MKKPKPTPPGIDAAWEHSRLAKVLTARKLGKPNLRADVWGNIAFRAGARVTQEDANHIAGVSYLDGYAAGLTVGKAETRRLTVDANREVVAALAAMRAEKKRTDRPIQIGDIIAINTDLSENPDGSPVGGVVVAIFGCTVTFRTTRGSFDVWHDIEDIFVIAPRPDWFEPEANEPLRADEFASDAESVDCKGRRIRLGDRVECNSCPACGIVVALVQDMVTFLNDWDEGKHNGVGVGNAYSCVGTDLRVRDSFSGGDVRDIRKHFADTVAEAEAVAAKPIGGGA